MRPDDDHAALGFWQEAGHRRWRQGRADDSAGRHGREGLEIEPRRALEALFGLGGCQRVAEGEIEVYRASQRALRTLPSVDEELAPVAEEGEVGGGHGSLGGPNGITSVEPILRDGLAGVALA